MRKPSPPAGLGVLTALLLFGGACSEAQFAPVRDGAVDPPAAPDTRDAGLEARPEADASCPASPVQGCEPMAAGLCDPVCQTGTCDWCSEKCSYAYGQSGTGPEPACVPAGTGTFPESCTVFAAGSREQSDDCAPGSICLTPLIGDDLSYCFSLCRVQADCPYGVACAARPLSAAGGEVLVCDPPYQQCGPDGTCCDPLGNQGCDPERICLLVSRDPGTQHSRTVCEFAYGDGRDGELCTTARDCQMRHTCVDGFCRQVCASTSPCPNGGTCVALGIEFGYCS